MLIKLAFSAIDNCFSKLLHKVNKLVVKKTRKKLKNITNSQNIQAYGRILKANLS